MTSKAALALALLEGRVLNVKNCFTEIGLTNITREIPRLIEKPFDVQIARCERTGINRYNQEVTWTDYHLNRTDYNLPGIEKMKEYVRPFIPTRDSAKTQKELEQIKMFDLL